MRLDAWGQTDIGRQRENNEDSLLFNPDMALFMVADGVGGGAAGEIASSMATSIVQRRVTEALDGLKASGEHRDLSKVQAAVLNSLNPALMEATEAVYNRGQTEYACRGMATTALVFQVTGNTGIIGHVGDSRLYMIRDREIYQITRDHTLYQQLLARGALSEDEAAVFPHKNVLARSIGREPTVEVDSLLIDVVPGDTFILCTDGLTDLVTPEEILKIATANPPRDAVARLIARANEQGGRDNITIVIVGAAGQPAREAVDSLRTEQKVSLLKSIFLFKDLSFAETVRVLRAVKEVKMPAGTVIIREGDYGDELFILVEGEVDVSQGGVYLTTLRPGTHFGELGLIGEGVRTATVQSRTDATLLCIRREDFFGLVNSDHNLAVQLLWGFLQKLANRMKSLSADYTREKRSR